jgi:hypothetical protein
MLSLHQHFWRDQTVHIHYDDGRRITPEDATVGLANLLQSVMFMT